MAWTRDRRGVLLRADPAASGCGGRVERGQVELVVADARDEGVGLCEELAADGQVVIDLDATLVAAHSDKQDATRTWKKTFGFHPLLGFVDYGPASHGSGGEPVAEQLRPGEAGSNTAADHIAVLDAALAQLPAPLRAPDSEGRITGAGPL